LFEVWQRAFEQQDTEMMANRQARAIDAAVAGNAPRETDMRAIKRRRAVLLWSK